MGVLALAAVGPPPPPPPPAGVHGDLHDQHGGRRRQPRQQRQPQDRVHAARAVVLALGRWVGSTGKSLFAQFGVWIGVLMRRYTSQIMNNFPLATLTSLCQMKIDFSSKLTLYTSIFANYPLPQVDLRGPHEQVYQLSFVGRFETGALPMPRPT